MQKLKALIRRLLSIQTIRYLISSCVAFAADYALLLLLDSLFRGATVFSMEISAVIAFAISSQINFWINRKWVFKSKKSPLPELGGYYSLSLVSFALKIFVFTEIMVRLIRLPLAVARPIAEVSLFAFNYLIQKTYIFRRKKNDPNA